MEQVEKLLSNPGEDTFHAMPTTIHRAAATGRIDAISYFVINQKVKPSAHDSSGVGAMHYAAEKGFLM